MYLLLLLLRASQDWKCLFLAGRVGSLPAQLAIPEDSCRDILDPSSPRTVQNVPKRQIVELPLANVMLYKQETNVDTSLL